MQLEGFGGEIAECLVGIAAFDERQALGEQSFQLDRAKFGAILLTLGALLRLLVVVERVFDPFAGAVEDVDDAPEQVL